MKPAPDPEAPFPKEIPDSVRAACEAVQGRKAVDPRLLHLREVSDFTDYFLVASGTSDRQVRAIAEAVQERLGELGRRPIHTEGLRQGKWVLIDYGDLVVHVFDQERRDFYRLERLWSDAPQLQLDA